MNKTKVLLLNWLPESLESRLRDEFSQCDFTVGREPAAIDAVLPQAQIVYGPLPAARLGEAQALQWLQLTSAGVPQDLCPVARARGLRVTNLAGLYGPSIAEHALALMTILARNLQQVGRQQLERCWDRTVRETMWDLHGRTLALVGLGNIGLHIARLARAYGMQVIGCRRRELPAPSIDRIYPLRDLHAMLAQADVLAVAAPLTRRTEGMLGPAEFAALKRGAIYINVSRGPVAQEPALLDALHAGQVRAAGLDVFATEPLPADHPFWTMPQVFISPHYSGETINQGPLPGERFLRNLHCWFLNRPLEGVVDLEWGY